MNKQKIKVAIVGLGRIASLLEDDKLREKPCTHAGAFSANPDCVIIAGADIDPERRALFAKRWSCAVYADAATMLKEQKPHILCIATKPDLHAEFCELAARNGVPVAVCEKPLADSIGAAQRIARLHESGKITILTNHERRYALDYRNAKAVLDAGNLGNVLSVRSTIYMGKNRKLMNVLWDDATHLADSVMFLTGAELIHGETLGAKLSEKTGTAFLYGTLEGTLEKNERKKLHIPFMMEAGAGRDHLVFEIEFSCEAGRLRIGNGIFEIWESKPSPYAERFHSLARTMDGFQGKTGYFSNMAIDAVSCVKDRSHRPVSSALDGLRVIRYLNSFFTSPPGFFASPPGQLPRAERV
jgi:predicted dehydrogenase